MSATLDQRVQNSEASAIGGLHGECVGVWAERAQPDFGNRPDLLEITVSVAIQADITYGPNFILLYRIVYCIYQLTFSK